MSEDEAGSRARRMAVRFTDEDLAFLTENAEDEGVEPATLVRMIVSRLRKGRQPLISMMEQVAPAPRAIQSVRAGVSFYQPPAAAPAPVDDGAADEVLASRLAELETADVVQLHQPPEEESAAIPLVRIPRQQYNPGRN